MSRNFTKKIEKIELIKIEKVFNNPELKMNYHYNLYLEGIDEPLILSSPDIKIDTSIVGMKIKYKLSDENLISNFELI